MSELLHVPVPTATVIAAHIDDPYLVAVFSSTGKHGNKKVLPGGRVKIGIHNWLQTGQIEPDEELAIKKLQNIEFFALASKPDRDVRTIPVKKWLDGRPMPDCLTVKEDDTAAEIEAKTNIVGHYTFDIVFMGRTDDKLCPDASEAKDAQYIDVRTVKPEEFALDHGYILVAYREYLETGKLPALDRF